MLSSPLVSLAYRCEAIFDNTDEDDWLANTPISDFCQDEGYIPITVQSQLEQA